jgi:hypothetical protein
MKDQVMGNPMDKQAQPNPENPQEAQKPQQMQNPQRNQGQGQQGQKARDPSQNDPSQRKQPGDPQDRYASGTDRARDVPVDRKGGEGKPGMGGSSNERGGKH